MTFDAVAARVAHFIGRPAMLGVCGVVSIAAIATALAGDNRLVNASNLTLSILTLLMLPILQAAQNRDTLAMHVKLDAITPGADLNRAEEKSEAEIAALRENCANPA